MLASRNCSLKAVKYYSVSGNKSFGVLLVVLLHIPHADARTFAMFELFEAKTEGPRFSCSCDVGEQSATTAIAVYTGRVQRVKCHVSAVR